MSEIKPRTNGDVVSGVMSNMNAKLAAFATEAVAHPDEAMVALFPVLFTFVLSLKYKFDGIESVIAMQLAAQASPVLLEHYREWKKSPAKPALRRVV